MSKLIKLNKFQIKYLESEANSVFPYVGKFLSILDTKLERDWSNNWAKIGIEQRSDGVDSQWEYNLFCVLLLLEAGEI